MINLILIFTLTLFAHDNLHSTKCVNGSEELSITNNGDDGYLFTYRKEEIRFDKPKVKDFWNPKYKQLFDTYLFENKTHKVTFSKPETKGPIKQTLATYKGKEFKCQ